VARRSPSQKGHAQPAATSFNAARHTAKTARKKDQKSIRPITNLD